MAIDFFNREFKRRQKWGNKRAALEEYIELFRNNIRRTIKAHHTFERYIWENDSGFTPKEMIEGLGTDAQKIINVMNKYRALVNAIRPAQKYIRPAGYTIVFDQDGNATVTEPTP